METAKAKIEALYDEYVRLFPDEYAAVVEQLKEKRKNLKTVWGEAKGMDAIQREVGEIPEKLFDAMMRALGKDEIKWLQEGDKSGDLSHGMKWFYKRYPQFRTTKAI